MSQNFNQIDHNLQHIIFTKAGRLLMQPAFHWKTGSALGLALELVHRLKPQLCAQKNTTAEKSCTEGARMSKLKKTFTPQEFCRQTARSPFTEKDAATTSSSSLLKRALPGMNGRLHFPKRKKNGSLSEPQGG